MKNLLLIAALISMQFAISQTPCSGGTAGVYPCDGYDLQSRVTLGTMSAGSGNDSWGWTDPQDGKEYAIMALDNGTAFVDISDPVNPVYLGKLPTHTSSSTWRDVKTYNNHAFIVSEANGHGMQVFDLTRLRNVSNPPQTFNSDAHFNNFGDAHNIVINEDTGYAYVVGSDFYNGGPYFINIQDPVNPIDEGGYSIDGYSHDAQVVTYNGPDSDHTGKEILIGSNANEVVIVDITNKAAPVPISTISYGNVGYTHQGWFTENQRYFILGDETDELDFGFNTRTIVFDFDDLDNPTIHFEYSGPTSAIDHNGYVKGNKYYLSNYRAGLRVLDITDIASGTMVEEGYFDTYPNNNNANFSGAWSVYPYFGSGNIVISDINRGLFIVKSANLDTTDPIAVCQNITAQLDENGEVVVSGSEVDGGSSDNSGSYTITLSQNSFDCSDIGTNNITVTVTDPSGNTDTCSATITIEDNIAPVLDCLGNQSVTFDEGEAFYTLPDYVALGEVSGTDNCTTSLSITQNPPAGTQLAEGVYGISFATTDDEGNSVDCSFELTVSEILSVETILAQGLVLYPNPTQSELVIFSGNVNLESIFVTDISGKRLMDVNNINSERLNLDMSSLSKGIYFININNLITKRVIKN
ncbi:MAG: choice-of-anchor B family protein [Flavobacteriaceae bacterium]|nr:choice-of-anchor B family protein [Flavobacteriaceae bacterium]